MIDSQSEDIITFAQAADALPRRRRGRKCHVSTLFRWTSVGCKGIRLESIQCGGTRCTSKHSSVSLNVYPNPARSGPLAEANPNPGKAAVGPLPNTNGHQQRPIADWLSGERDSPSAQIFDMPTLKNFRLASLATRIPPVF
jgi:hypothetical protein